MRFAFDERKAAQAAAFIISLRGGRLNYMVLVKLLYLADRASLLECGQPITGDRMFSLPHGTILSNVLDLVSTGEAPPGSPWFTMISEPVRYVVELVDRTPPTDELSEFEIGILRQVEERYRGLDQWALKRITHGLPEYRDPGSSRIPIRPEDILRLEGKSDEEVELLTQEAEELWFLDRLRDQAS